MYKNSRKIKTYKIHETRENLSSFVQDVSNKPYFIGKRGVPTAVIVDYEVAIKSLPAEYMQSRKGAKTANNLAQYILAKSKEKPTNTVTNLSERVDEIVYAKP